MFAILIEKIRASALGGSQSFYLAFALRLGALYSDFFFKPKACTWSELLPNWAMTCSLTASMVLWKSHSAAAAVSRAVASMGVDSAWEQYKLKSRFAAAKQ